MRWLARTGPFLLIATVVGALALLVWQRDRAASFREDRLAQRLNALESAALARVPERKRAEPPVYDPVAVGQAAPISTTISEPGSMEADTPPSPSPRAYRDEELSVLFANQYDSEPIDGPWARGAEISLGNEIKAHLPNGSTIVGLECRSRFCRLEIVHESIDVANEMMLNLFHMERNGPLSMTNQGFRQGDPISTPDGKKLFTVYIGRAGTPMTLQE